MPDAGVHPSNHSGQVASPSHNTHFGVSSQPDVNVLDIGRKLEYLDRTSLEMILEYSHYDVMRSTAPPCSCWPSCIDLWQTLLFRVFKCRQFARLWKGYILHSTQKIPLTLKLYDFRLRGSNQLSPTVFSVFTTPAHTTLGTFLGMMQQWLQAF